MAQRYDIMLGADNDLPIETNMLQLARSDQQHVGDIIETGPGQWKQFPTNGFLIEQYLNSSGKQALMQKLLNAQLENDGYKGGPGLITVLPGGDVQIDTAKIERQ
jgi:hypothetical protein